MIIRTRFAPSPTGNPHIGSIWTALFNWLYARHCGGKFILRIEDTDRARLVPEAETKIIEALRWFNIDYDEGPDVSGPYGPYRQSERLPLYGDAASKLIDVGAAYYCFCSPERLEEIRNKQKLASKPMRYDGYCRSLDAQESKNRKNKREAFVVRLKIPSNKKILVDDLIRGNVVFDSEIIDDQILLKSNGWPTYHLASVVDDHLMRINPIIRAEEWLPSTPKQLLIYQALGWDPPHFAHLPLILGPDRSKLSKRHGSTDVLQYREEGYLPEAIINYLVLLGWSPKTDQEFFTRDEIIKRFTVEAINKSGAIFDQQKLDWFNANYIRRLPLEKMSQLFKPYIEKAGGKNLSEDKLGQVSLMAAQRIKKLSEINIYAAFLFKAPVYDANLLIWKKGSKNETAIKLSEIADFLKSLDNEIIKQEDALGQAIKEYISKNNLGVGETLWPMRVALTGLKESPGPFTVIAILGKEECLTRIKAAIDKLT